MLAAFMLVEALGIERVWIDANQRWYDPRSFPRPLENSGFSFFQFAAITGAQCKPRAFERVKTFSDLVDLVAFAFEKRDAENKPVYERVARLKLGDFWWPAFQKLIVNAPPTGIYQNAVNRNHVHARNWTDNSSWRSLVHCHILANLLSDEGHPVPLLVRHLSEYPPYEERAKSSANYFCRSSLISLGISQYCKLIKEPSSARRLSLQGSRTSLFIVPLVADPRWGHIFGLHSENAFLAQILGEVTGPVYSGVGRLPVELTKADVLTRLYQPGTKFNPRPTTMAQQALLRYFPRHLDNPDMERLVTRCIFYNLSLENSAAAQLFLTFYFIEPVHIFQRFSLDDLSNIFYALYCFSVHLSEPKLRAFLSLVFFRLAYNDTDTRSALFKHPAFIPITAYRSSSSSSSETIAPLEIQERIRKLNSSDYVERYVALYKRALPFGTSDRAASLKTLARQVKQRLKIVEQIAQRTEDLEIKKIYEPRLAELTNLEQQLQAFLQESLAFIVNGEDLFQLKHPLIARKPAVVERDAMFDTVEAFLAPFIIKKPEPRRLAEILQVLVLLVLDRVPVPKVLTIENKILFGAVRDFSLDPNELPGRSRNRGRFRFLAAKDTGQDSIRDRARAPGATALRFLCDYPERMEHATFAEQCMVFDVPFEWASMCVIREPDRRKLVVDSYMSYYKISEAPATDRRYYSEKFIFTDLATSAKSVKTIYYIPYRMAISAPGFTKAEHVISTDLLQKLPNLPELRGVSYIATTDGLVVGIVFDATATLARHTFISYLVDNQLLWKESSQQRRLSDVDFVDDFVDELAFVRLRIPYSFSYGLGDKKYDVALYDAHGSKASYLRYLYSRYGEYALPQSWLLEVSRIHFMSLLSPPPTDFKDAKQVVALFSWLIRAFDDFLVQYNSTKDEFRRFLARFYILWWLDPLLEREGRIWWGTMSSFNEWLRQGESPLNRIDVDKGALAWRVLCFIVSGNDERHATALLFNDLVLVDLKVLKWHDRPVARTPLVYSAEYGRITGEIEKVIDAILGKREEYQVDQSVTDALRDTQEQISRDPLLKDFPVAGPFLLKVLWQVSGDDQWQFMSWSKWQIPELIIDKVVYPTQKIYDIWRTLLLKHITLRELWDIRELEFRLGVTRPQLIRRLAIKFGQMIKHIESEE
jgi:hypothetical protein